MKLTSNHQKGNFVSGKIQHSNPASNPREWRADDLTGINFDPNFCDKTCIASCYDYAINNPKFKRSSAWDSINLDYENSPLATREGLTKRLITAMEMDGLTYVGKAKPDMKGRDGYLIAFYLDFTAPGRYWDYHFLRQDNRHSERWSGKSGDLISDRDRKRRKITNPATADMGDYKFVGYLIAPKGGLVN